MSDRNVDVAALTRVIVGHLDRWEATETTKGDCRYLAEELLKEFHVRKREVTK